MPEDSTCFSYSNLMGGIADDPGTRLDQLFDEFVSRFEKPIVRQRRDEAAIEARIEEALTRRNLRAKIDSNVELKGVRYSHKFRFAWMNGTRQVLEPISLDYLQATEVIEKANTWTGRLVNLNASGQFMMTGVVSKPQSAELEGAFAQAKQLLEAAPGMRAVIQEEEIDGFLPEIEGDLAMH